MVKSVKMINLYDTLIGNPSITRRELLKIGGFAAVVGGLETILGRKVNAASLKSRVTFEEALHNTSLRERYTREVLEEMFGNDVHKYFINIYYDHDKSKVKGVIDTVDWNKLIIAAAMGVEHGGKFGKGLKSDLYVFGDLFNTYEVQTQRGILKLQPTETRIKAKLTHEFLHGKHYFEGIKLEDGSSLDSSNYTKIDKYVKEFVKEVGGFIKEINTSMELEKPDLRYLSSTEFEKLPPAYVTSLLSFKNYLIYISEHIRPEKVPFSDLRYVIHQLKQIKRRTPEMEGFDVVKDLYKSFGIK